ncbi:MAG: KPN_02809 family neutral zinc metallopeptidase [Gemmatimonadaceae bacterium]
MRWTPEGDNSDVEDRRGQTGGRLGGYGPHLGIGGTVVVLLLSVVFHRDFFALLGGGTEPGPAQTVSAPATQSPEEGKLVQFVTFVLNDDQRSWERLLPATYGVPYHHAKLVLFRDATQTACGVGQEAMGPFYCPTDEKLYIDLGFYDELRRRFGAPGEFAEAYVIAHELGHHVQKLLGIESRVREAMSANRSNANALSVRLELQADCFAGVWGHTTEQRSIVDQNDVREGLNAAAAVGDDRLQRMSKGRVSPDNFTHGTSAQRVGWFKRGLDNGDPKACDTFNGNGIP